MAEQKSVASSFGQQCHSIRNRCAKRNCSSMQQRLWFVSSFYAVLALALHAVHAAGCWVGCPVTLTCCVSFLVEGEPLPAASSLIDDTFPPPLSGFRVYHK